LQSVSLKRGIFFDSLSLMLIDEEVGFDLFKAKVATPEPYAEFGLRNQA
jgi:hypothetical protein